MKEDGWSMCEPTEVQVVEGASEEELAISLINSESSKTMAPIGFVQASRRKGYVSKQRDN